MVRLGAADSTSGELSGLEEKPAHSARCAERSSSGDVILVAEGAGGEIATMGAPFLRKEDSEGDEASGDLAARLDLLELPLGGVSVSMG